MDNDNQTARKPFKNSALGFLQGAAAGLAVIAAAVGGMVYYGLDMPGHSYEGPFPGALSQDEATAQKLRAHVTAIASAPHNIAHYEALEKAALYLEQTLAALGYRTQAQVFEVSGKAVRNIEATIEPQETANAQSLVIGAHYDSAGAAPGANDNGSGTAVLLELAQALRAHRPQNTRVRLVFFVNEEPPYFQTEDMGSVRYVRLLKARGENIQGMISLETLGYFSSEPSSQKYPPPFGLALSRPGDFVSFVGTLDSRPLIQNVTGLFREHAKLPTIGGAAPGLIAGVTLSDHWAFSQQGAPGLMVTDTAMYRYPHYHKPTDTPDKLDYVRLAHITRGMAHVIRQLAPSSRPGPARS